MCRLVRHNQAEHPTGHFPSTLKRPTNTLANNYIVYLMTGQETRIWPTWKLTPITMAGLLDAAILIAVLFCVCKGMDCCCCSGYDEVDKVGDRETAQTVV